MVIYTLCTFRAVRKTCTASIQIPCNKDCSKIRISNQTLEYERHRKRNCKNVQFQNLRMFPILTNALTRKIVFLTDHLLVLIFIVDTAGIALRDSACKNNQISRCQISNVFILLRFFKITDKAVVL